MSRTIAPRHPHRSRWTAQERADLRDLLEQGYGIVDAVRLFRRVHPHRSERGAMHQAGLLLGYRGGERLAVSVLRVRSQREVSALMGVDPKTVATWVERGWLQVARTRPVRRTEWRRGGPTVLIHDTDVDAFLRHPPAWPSFDPARIADPDWRQAAEEARAAAGGRWVAVADVVGEAGYTRHLASRFIHTYPGAVALTEWRKTHFLWSGDVPAFVSWLRYPGRRPRRKEAA